MKVIGCISLYQILCGFQFACLYAKILIYRPDYEILNMRPIIGVLAHKLAEKDPRVHGTSYITSSYVKYLEMAGARVVPIHTNHTEESLTKLFKQINGVLFPGGDADLMNSHYRKNSQFIYKLAKQEFDEGGYFPIFGTCLGFQMLAVLVADSDDVISPSKGTWDQSLNLNFETKSSRIFEKASEDVVNILQFKEATYNAHYNCVKIEAYHQNQKLMDFFRVATTSKEKNGESFVSTFEGRSYPFYGTQWHPEMIFEFSTNEKEDLGYNINHSSEAVLISQYVANFFVTECRRSKHRFINKREETQALIYNYQPIFAAPLGYFQEEMYIFP